MNPQVSPFDEFVASLEGLQLSHDADAVSGAERNTIGSVFGTVKTFLQEHNLVSAESLGSLEGLKGDVVSFSDEMPVTQLDIDSIVGLCTACKIDGQYLRDAVESVALCITNYSGGYDLGEHFRGSQGSMGAHGDFQMRELSSLFSAQAVESFTMTPEASLEAFGATSNNTIADARVAVTVALLRYHRSALHRLLPSLPTPSNIVSFKVDHNELFDLAASRDNSSTIREGAHRVPFIDLYRDPSPANTALKPIILRTANDAAAPNNVLVDENMIKMNTDFNMFDLSIDAGKVGYQHVDYTDLVGDNVRVKKLFVTVTNGTVTEVLAIETETRAQARLTMTNNATDSADRSCAMKSQAAFDLNAVQSDGSASVLLAGLSADAVIKLDYNIGASLNLRTSAGNILGTSNSALATKSGDAVLGADGTLFGTLTFTLTAGELAANFSEENIRKTTKSLRILTKQVGYEIPGSSNVIVQYSLTEARPETVVDALTKAISIGHDDRGINLILDTLNSVYDRIQEEKALGSNIDYTRAVGNDYVAGQRVKPSVFMGSIDITADVSNMRSGELWGDIRGLVEKYLMEVTVRLNNESYYSNEIGMGEKRVFSVLTSGWILSALLSTPHYHNHLGDNAKDATNDGITEYRRTLPNGVVLNVVTTTFDFMTDKIVMVPVRPNSPRSVLNFGANRERGTYVVKAQPTQDSAMYNSLIANAREAVLPTCPIGAVIQVSGITNVFDSVGTLGA